MTFCRLILPALGLAASLSAGQIDAIYAFGDSLSDAGNVYALSGGTIPGSAYSSGRFTNGNVWVQDLGADLGLAVTASIDGGTDYAYGSAQSGVTLFNPSAPFPSFDLTGASGQIAQYQATHPTADPNALYTIWIGSNDLDAIPASATPAQIAMDLGQITTNIDSAITTLAGEGAQDFLIADVPDLGKTPEAIAGGPGAIAAASALSAEFDYSFLIPSLSAIPGVDLSVLDTYALLDGIVANPSAYGFDDVTDACLTGVDYSNYSGGTACATPNTYLFWDQEHPTAAANALVAAAAASIVTPEPSSLGLASLGALGLLFLFSRWQKPRRTV
jgi:phospholipase/lecithinase/hemolysin